MGTAVEMAQRFHFVHRALPGNRQADIGIAMGIAGLGAWLGIHRDYDGILVGPFRGV